jgi:NAD(P)-dependent dehydrogenase (short-subunit alcohol dehydrogenase family)
MNKTILITGASSGIGHATARRFADQGWNVIATMRQPDEATELADRANVLVAHLDVQDRASIGAAIAAGRARFGKIDALLNNAGFSLFGVFESLSREKIQEQFDVNVFGVMDVTRALLPHFRENQGGLILNLSSRGGLVGLPMISLYCASKYALEGFSESLAYELASQNIVVKIIEPSGGVTGTNFSERLGRERADPAATPPDYNAFVTRTSAAFASMGAARKTSADEVAQAIYHAATDGTNQLRYFTGEDVGGFVQAKRERTDQGYIDFMRARFLPPEQGGLMDQASSNPVRYRK